MGLLKQSLKFSECGNLPRYSNETLVCLVMMSKKGSKYWAQAFVCCCTIDEKLYNYSCRTSLLIFIHRMVWEQLKEKIHKKRNNNV